MTTVDLITRLGRWDTGTGPLYRQLARELRRILETGQIQTGDALPPERALAGALAVSRTTVSSAYAELRSQGWIDARQGSATRVTAARHSPVGAHKANGLFATLLAEHPDVLDLTVAVPEAAPVVAEVLQAPRDHVADPELLFQGHGYHPRGLAPLREALARTLTQRGLPTDGDELIVTSGALQAISLAVAGLVRPGDDVVIEEVTFPGALDALSWRGARMRPVPVVSDSASVDRFEQRLRQSRPRLAYLIPTFHNPTGGLLAGTPRRRLARIVAEQGVTTIDDVTLGELDYDTPAPAPLAAFEPEAPIITVGSMSKVFWGGLRIGWIRARPPVIDHLTGVKASADLGTSAPVQVLAWAMLDRYHETRSWRKARLAESLAAATDTLGTLVPEWAWDRPAGGPHLWIRLPDTDAMAFAQRMMRRGVAVVAGPLQAVDAAVATDRIRIPLYLGPARLSEAISMLAEGWRARR